MSDLTLGEIASTILAVGMTVLEIGTVLYVLSSIIKRKKEEYNEKE